MVSVAEENLVQEQLEEVHEHHSGDEDEVVFYDTPEAEVDGDVFGLAGTNVDGTQWTVGDCEALFPLQSISKVVTYALALEDNGRDATLRRVGVEPSGDPFNSITFDDVHNRPHNPMINAGALVAAQLVAGADRAEKVERLLARVRAFTGNHEVVVDADLLAGEMETNDRNLAISYLMRSLGMLSGDIVENLAVYLSACSMTVTTCDLAVLGATLAHGGRNPMTGERAMPERYVRDVVSVMMTCGMYDAAGEWATDVGIPAKSGVAVFRELSRRFGLHVFAGPGESRFGRLTRTGPGRRIEQH